MDINRITSSTLQNTSVKSAQGKTQNTLEQVGQTFQEALDNLSKTQENSDDLIQKLAQGEDVDLHTVMIAAEQTDVNFRVAVAIRDKLVDAYREIMRMAV
ncbi:MAG: flagellar hook-basal body complex protein FliE [Anaerolineales bacterium]